VGDPVGPGGGRRPPRARDAAAVGGRPPAEPGAGHLVSPAERSEDRLLAAWRRRTRGEHRWPSVVAIALAIVLQLLLPDRLILHPRWLLPGVEIALLVVLVLGNPVRLERELPLLRLGSLGLILTMTVANAGSAVLLIQRLLTGQAGDDAVSLIGSGAAIYATNVIAFGVWYWELDRGGPFARAAGRRQHTDFLFPQMTQPDVAPPDWEPTFLDYLYVSYTNATAFSPTDTMPLSRWAKMLMLVQSAVALSTVALVIARAVNVLP
jgi:hypothetical protein